MANDRGDVVLSYTNQNPALYGKVWFRDRECPSFTVLRVYEHVSRSSIGEDETNKKTTLLFGGREDGTIVSLHPQKGTVEFITQAHSASVSLLIANPQKDQLVSCGRDSAVKVWKVLPFDMRGLLLLRLTLCYTRHMTHIAIIWDILCLAVCDHTIVMYNLHDKGAEHLDASILGPHLVKTGSGANDTSVKGYV
ncbi:unnamed protein product, partial [Timema podura]|nr:unnamed protein product [Timema podura]